MLISALRGSPRHLVVDLSGVTFCRVQELTLLLGIGADAAANGIGYSVSGVPASLNRADKFLWGGGQPVHHRCAATAVTAIRAGQLASGGQRHAEGSARPAGHAPTAADGRPRLEIARIERQ
jgi:hypothetical protein